MLEKQQVLSAVSQEIKRDVMQPLLNAFSVLGKEDGAAIQILLRPARDGWVKAAQGVASKTRKDKGVKKVSTGGWLKQVAVALSKPPEHKEVKPEDKQLTSLEQATVDAIDDKSRHPGFETLIRIVSSSNTTQRSQTILSNILATFSLFDAPGKNGFKFKPVSDIDKLTTDYILRMFPFDKSQNVLNSVELATLFHFPDQNNTPTSQLERQASKQVDGPRNVPDKGMLLGYNVFRGEKREIRLSDTDRQRHMYVVGQTGTGKSVYLKNLAIQDMLEGNGFAFIDPHGDAAEDMLKLVPRERTEDVIYFCPSDMDYPLGLNLFEYKDPGQKDFLIQEAINMLYKLYDPQRQGIIGPRYEHLFRNAALVVMAGPDGGTLIDIPKLFNDKAFVQEKLKYVTDQTVLDFWNKEMPASERSNDFGEVKSWFVSKFSAFLQNEMMRNIIGQTHSSFDLRDIMDNKKILLVNLSKGKTGDLNSKLLGMMFVMKFQAAAMSRADMPEDKRVDFCLYVDEFQNFSTESFATILAEARKYRLNLIVANQYIGQLTDEIRDAVFGNVGSIVNLRASANDAEFLVRYFQPTFDIDDIVKMPNYTAIVKTMINGVPTSPFSMATLPPLGHPSDQLGIALKQLSAAKYGKPRAIVEEEILKRITVSEPVAPANQFGFGAKPPGAGFGPAGQNMGMPNAGGFTGPGTPGSPTPLTNSAQNSFLDEWMARRRAAGVPGTGQNLPATSAPQSPTPQANPAQFAQPTQPPVNQFVPVAPQKSVTSTPLSASLAKPMDTLEPEHEIGTVPGNKIITNEPPLSDMSQSTEDEARAKLTDDELVKYGLKDKPDLQTEQPVKSDELILSEQAQPEAVPAVVVEAKHEPEPVHEAPPTIEIPPVSKEAKSSVVVSEEQGDPLLGLGQTIPSANLAPEKIAEEAEHFTKSKDKSQVYIDKDGIMHYGGGE
jgi:hypothetical protein